MKLSDIDPDSGNSSPEGKPNDNPGVNHGVNDWWKTESPDQDVNHYVNHPLNFNQSEGLAQTLRGLEGILGSLRYAIVDIAVGLARFTHELFTAQKP